MADIIKVAEQLNSEVTRLNNERSKLEGMLESAKTNFEKAVKAYEAKYGVKLTESTLQEEYNRVFAETKGAILDLQEKIESIKRGDYKNNAEPVEYDLEPDVEPIRAVVEPKKEPVKRTRKSKKTEVEEPVMEIKGDDIVSQSEISTPTVETPVVETPVVPTVETPTVETPTVEEPKKNTISKKSGRKPLSGAALSAAIAANETAHQNPVTLGVEDEDEVDISGMDMSFGAKPAKGEAPVSEPTPNFASFGDLGTVEEKKEAPVTSEPSFGDFGGFGDLGTAPATKPVEEPKKESEPTVPDVGFGDFGGFGGFGDLGTEPASKPVDEPKKEEKKDAPAGWGDFNFGDFSGFGDVLNSDGFNFGG